MEESKIFKKTNSYIELTINFEAKSWPKHITNVFLLFIPPHLSTYNQDMRYVTIGSSVIEI